MESFLAARSRPIGNRYPSDLSDRMSDANKAIEQAIAVFVQGFCFGRSLTFPHAAERIDKLWVLRDAERSDPTDYRKEEWIAFNVEPAVVDAAARQFSRGRYFVGAVLENNGDEAGLRREYKLLGYRLLATEPLMVHSLKRIPRAACSPRMSTLRIERVTTREMAQRFAAASNMRLMTAEQLEDAKALRQYVAIIQAEIVGWVRSVQVTNSTDCNPGPDNSSAGDSAWVANMMVLPDYRRRGIGKTMLAKLLRDDRRFSVRQSVLLASHSGALLYPQLGYQQLGKLFIYSPSKC